MAILTLAQFFQELRVTEYSLNLNENIRASRSENGQIWTVSNGVRLWEGYVQCGTYTHAGNERIEAIASQLARPGQFFLFTPKKRPRPLSYPTGALASVTVNTAPSAGYTLSLKGLPASFKFTAGDYLSFVIQGTHRLYQVALDATANTSGVVIITLTSPLTVGALPTAGQAVTLINPLLTAQIKPGTLSYGSVGLASTSGISFEFVQAIRAS